MFSVGEAFGFFMLALSSVVAGLHKKYNPSPDGFKRIVSPRQMVESLPGFKVTKSTTRTRTESVFTHPSWLSSTVYVVVIFGYTRGLDVPGLNICVLGVQVYNPIPLAINSSVSML